MNLRRRRVIFVTAVPLEFGLLSLALGRDANWDLQNYHWYNPYAFLTDRYDLDIAADRLSELSQRPKQTSATSVLDNGARGFKN